MTGVNPDSNNSSPAARPDRVVVPAAQASWRTGLNQVAGGDGDGDVDVTDLIDQSGSSTRERFRILTVDS